MPPFGAAGGALAITSRSAQILSYVAGVIRRHRAAIGSCWRKLNPGSRRPRHPPQPLATWPRSDSTPKPEAGRRAAVIHRDLSMAVEAVSLAKPDHLRSAQWLTGPGLFDSLTR